MRDRRPPVWRLLLWVATLAALLMPPATRPHAAGPASTPAAGLDCADHAASPPCPEPPCPDQDTARHAAGDCCVHMAVPAALLPALVVLTDRPRSAIRIPFVDDTAAGLPAARDPPPPRP